MNYYIDTEFLEGVQKENFPISLFRKKTPNTIDLISIGIVAEDGREYYAISKDFNLKEAWNRFDIIKGDSTMVKSIGDNVYEVKNYWIRENVILPIYYELCLKDNDISVINYGNYNNFIVAIESSNSYKDVYKNLKRLINKYGKTNKQIVKEVKDFVSQKNLLDKNVIDHYGFTSNALKTFKGRMSCIEHNFGKPEFYAYFADYDWVAFCWLFGKMIDLPDGWPQYCKDLKQELDTIVDAMHLERPSISKEQCLKELKSLDFKYSKLIYPKQTNEHNALADAKWNFELHKFILTFNNK